MSRRRPLSDEERALWPGYCALDHAAARSAQRAAANRPAGDSPAAASTPSRRGARQPESAAGKKAPPLAPLGRRLKQRVARGREPIDARLDLHGMTQREAHAALLRFLRGAQADGARMALVVTGKGTQKRARRPCRRRTRRAAAAGADVAVAAGISLLVVGFEDAHVGHGGEGALYVRLRRSALITPLILFNLNHWNAGPGARNGQFRLAKRTPRLEYRQSCPTCPKPPIRKLKPLAMRGNSSDKEVLAQVEKWMAMIREISREPQARDKAFRLTKRA